MFNEMGYDTGIDFAKILAVQERTCRSGSGNYSGHNINIQNNTWVLHTSQQTTSKQ